MAAGSVIGLGAAVAGAQVTGTGGTAVDPIDLGDATTGTSTNIDTPVSNPPVVRSTTLSDDDIDYIDYIDYIDHIDDSPGDSPDTRRRVPGHRRRSPDRVGASPDSVDVSRYRGRLSGSAG